MDSATALTVSVVRVDDDSQPIAPHPATDISYRVSTFAPQANEIAFRLTEYFGISPGNPESVYGAQDILDTAVLKRASVFGVISTVYAMLASKERNDNFWKKSIYYGQLFEKARQRCRLSIDIGGDGVADVTKLGGSTRLMRD